MAFFLPYLPLFRPATDTQTRNRKIYYFFPTRGRVSCALAVLVSNEIMINSYENEKPIV
ncbi:hypothetical protein OKW21_005874 [Catalinimonas alkaloidigena]|nr:hypothetical protein [Catalinimonas alkaloidigena]